MSAVVGTLRGAGITPACPQCGNNEHVRRMWVGGKKMWYCDVHFAVTSTAKKDASLWQRLTHKLPEADAMQYSEIFPNRAYRRRQRGRR